MPHVNSTSRPRYRVILLFISELRAPKPTVTEVVPSRNKLGRCDVTDDKIRERNSYRDSDYLRIAFQ